MTVPTISGELPLVSVVTLTRGRPEQLIRTIDSVAVQRGVDVEHIVLGDDCPELRDPVLRAELTARHSHLVIRNVPRRQEIGYLPARLAQLRNLGVRLASADLIAQLDDDNAFEPNHLRWLVDALREPPRAEAAHSWRRLFEHDDKPYIPAGHDPWHPRADVDGKSFDSLCRLGILTEGSNLVRDRLDTKGAMLPRVDTSEFLVTRSLHLRCPWQTRFSRGARRLGFTEDLAFSVALVRHGIQVAQSRQPSLRYYMGGYSNHLARLPSATG